MPHILRRVKINIRVYAEIMVAILRIKRERRAINRRWDQPSLSLH